jgi:hypothetical protein
MSRILFLLIVIFLTIRLSGQDPLGDYNPYVSTASINPEPLLPSGANGTGTFSFELGNSGVDPLGVFPGQNVLLTITLSNGVPDNIIPVLAIEGSSADLFTWAYSSGEFTGTQIATIPEGSSGTITIA